MSATWLATNFLLRGIPRYSCEPEFVHKYAGTWVSSRMFECGPTIELLQQAPIVKWWVSLNGAILFFAISKVTETSLRSLDFADRERTALSASWEAFQKPWSLRQRKKVVVPSHFGIEYDDMEFKSSLKDTLLYNRWRYRIISTDLRSSELLEIKIFPMIDGSKPSKWIEELCYARKNYFVNFKGTRELYIWNTKPSKDFIINWMCDANRFCNEWNFAKSAMITCWLAVHFCDQKPFVIRNLLQWKESIAVFWIE